MAMRINSTLLKISVTFFIVAASLSIFANTSYTGRIVYNNKMQTPLNGVEVMLKDFNDNVIYTTLTNEFGNYEFLNIEEANYILDVNYDAEVGGIDFQDLSLIIKQIIGVKELEGLSYMAGDVDGSGVIDWNDFEHFLFDWFLKGEEFKAGKWAFQSRTLDLSGAEMKAGEIDFIACMGDGDNDWEPGVKNSPVGLKLEYKDAIPTSYDNYYELPVNYAGFESLGGFGLVFKCSENILIEDVTSQVDNLNYSFENGMLRISWINTNINLNAIDNDAPLFTIKARVADNSSEKNLFSIDSESHLIDHLGVTIDNSTITMPIIEQEVIKAELKNIYPNPVKDRAYIEYELVSESNVVLSIYNTSGQKLAELVRAVQSPNKYQVVLDVNNLNLTNGMYIYRLDCSGEQNYTESKILIVNK